MPVPVPAPESKEPVRVDPPKPQYAPVAAASPVARPDTGQPRKPHSGFVITGKELAMLSPITSADQSDESNETYAFTPAEYRRLAWYRAAVAAGFYNRPEEVQSVCRRVQQSR